MKLNHNSSPVELQLFTIENPRASMRLARRIALFIGTYLPAAGTVISTERNFAKNT